MMSRKEAKQVCRRLRVTLPSGRKLRCEVDSDGKYVERRTSGGYRDVPDDRITFTGGTSDHSIWRSASSKDRILAHWDGYARANGAPRVGDIARFPSGSARSGERTGRIVEVAPSRVRIHYRFKHGGDSEKWVPVSKIKLRR